MLIKSIVNRLVDLKELDELEKYRVNLNRVINKHRRKLIRTKIYIKWENKYQGKRVKLFITRLITLGFRRNINDLTVSFNRLTSLIDALNKATRDYLSWVKNS